jgi:hypothetical protein
MSRSLQCHCRRAAVDGVRSTLGAALLAAVMLSGCVAPYSGCVSPYPTEQAPSLPGSWVQRNVPSLPAPVRYEQRAIASPPVFELQPTPSLEPATPPDLSPESIPPLPSVPEVFQLPPPAPAAETAPLPAPPAAGPGVTPAMIDELTGQIAGLDRRLDEQSRALQAARHESDAARQATQRLQSDFSAWRAELDVVRETIEAQSAADLQALDEVNSALEQLLSAPAAPAHPPADSPPPPPALGRHRRGVPR